MPTEPISTAEPISEALCPMYGETFWTNFLVAEILGVIASTPFVLSLTEGLWAVFGYLVTALLFVPFVFLFVYFSARKRHRNSGFITTDGKSVSVRHRFGGELCFCSENLSECRWFRGSTAWATVPWSSNQFGPWFTGKSLLIEFPAHCRTETRYKTNKKGNKTVTYPPGPVIVAVGQTPESEREWEALLFQLGIPHDPQREAQAAPLSDECVLTAILATLAAGFAVSYGFAKLLYNILLQFQVSTNIADGVWLCTVDSGVLLPSFALMASLFFRRRDQNVKTSGQFLMTPWEVVGWFVGSVLLVMFVFWLNPELSDPAKTTASMVLGVITVVAIFVFVGIVKTNFPDEKPADESLHVPTEDVTVDDFSKYSGHFDGKNYGP